MKNLPSVYKNSDLASKVHNKEFCYVVSQDDVLAQIDKIFDSLGPIYKKKVLIETIHGEFKTFIYRRSGNYLITVSDEKILIDDILSIRRVL